MKKTGRVVLVAAIVLITAGISKANMVYQLEIFTENGLYAHSSSIDLYFEVVSNGLGMDFTFHNNSTVDSSIARIYFDDIGLLAYSGISNGTGTEFHTDSSPGNMPAGKALTQSYEADISFGALMPPPHNGINPGEWVTISFNLTGNNTSTDVINALDNNNLRVGVHLIALPDGSSESAVHVPEPATIALLGFGSLVLARRKRAK